MGSWKSFYSRGREERQDWPSPGVVERTALEAPGRGSYTSASELPGGAVEREIHPVVLLHLVDRGPGPILRSQPADLADLAGPQPHHRRGAVHQYDRVGENSGETRAVADLPPVPHAVLRVELRGAGEGAGILPHLLSPMGGAGGGLRRVRGPRRDDPSGPEAGAPD